MGRWKEKTFLLPLCYGVVIIITLLFQSSKINMLVDNLMWTSMVAFWLVNLIILVITKCYKRSSDEFIVFGWSTSWSCIRDSKGKEGGVTCMYGELFVTNSGTHLFELNKRSGEKHE
ncbi:hypothetical protein ACLB2K_070228 [Fragaria x ananassa]